MCIIICDITGVKNRQINIKRRVTRRLITALFTEKSRSLLLEHPKHRSE